MKKLQIIVYSGATAAMSLGLVAGMLADTNENGASLQAEETSIEAVAQPATAEEEAATTEFRAPQDRQFGATRPTPPAVRPLDPGADPATVQEREARQADPGPQATPPAARGQEPTYRPAEPEWRTQRETRDPAIPMGAPRLRSPQASELLEHRVENHLGEDLGVVSDFAIDRNTGRVEFIAIGPGDPVRVIPPQAFYHLPFEDRLVLSMTGDQWEHAPMTRRADLAQLAEENEARDIYEFYGIDYPTQAMDRPTREGRPTFGAPAHRWQQRHQAEPHVMPLDPAEPRLERDRLPEAERRTETDAEWYQDSEGATEFGATGDRDVAAVETPTETGWRAGSFESRLGLRERMDQFGPRGRQPQAEFGTPPQREAARMSVREEERLLWASDLIGREVIDSRLESTGEVSDLIVNLRTGQVQHIIVRHEEDQQFAIPMRTARIGEDRLTVRQRLQDLQRAPRYEERSARAQPDQSYRFEADPAGMPTEFGAPEHREREDASKEQEHY